MFFSRFKTQMPTEKTAHKGRPEPIETAREHFVLKRPIKPPFPKGIETAIFGLGCFWGAERKFWQIGDGIWSTAVGYTGGLTPNPTYDEVCTGRTGHNEAVFVAFDASVLSYDRLLKVFFESHDPTQGMRQGNDVGTQYRSGIYTFSEEQSRAAHAAKALYQRALSTAGLGTITTEILSAPPFYYAEEYHQQYLAKVPGGYCGLGGTGVACALPTGVTLE